MLMVQMPNNRYGMVVGRGVAKSGVSPVFPNLRGLKWYSGTLVVVSTSVCNIKRNCAMYFFLYTGVGTEIREKTC